MFLTQYTVYVRDVTSGCLSVTSLAWPIYVSLAPSFVHSSAFGFSFFRQTTALRPPLSFQVWWFLRVAIATSNTSALGKHAAVRSVLALYAALAAGDGESVNELVDRDLEWWFHGPPDHQHMMLLLTGVTSCDTFSFQPARIAAREDRVFVEGSGPSPGVFWVHIWTVKDGRISQLREYFNTAVTVTDLKPSRSLARPNSCRTLWQSELCKGQGGSSLPGLIVAV